ncbi:MAG: ABC transporter permease [Burkholderiaceae bacterium]|nr:ABC transporter permease [Burkholderiaceae bacterium]
MTAYAALGALQLGFIYGLVAIGVLLSFRMLNFPDLTVDGSFPLGAAASAAVVASGGNPWLALVVAIVAGAGAGAVTGFLSQRLRILDLLAGILTMTALYSVNIRVMGRPNLPLLGHETITDDVVALGLDTVAAKLWIAALASLLAVGLVSTFLASRYGLSVRATGANPRMAAAVGVSCSQRIYVGLALSNGLCGLAGGLFAQLYGFADVSMGVGTIVVGLAAVILGEAFVRSWSPLAAVVACVGGAIAYRFTISLALESESLGLTTSDLNLISAVVVTAAFLFTKYSRRMHLQVKPTQAGSAKASR